MGFFFFKFYFIFKIYLFLSFPDAILLLCNSVGLEREKKKTTTIWIVICSCQSSCSRLPGGCWTTLCSHQVSLTMPTGFLFPEPGWEAQISQQPCKLPSAEESVPSTGGAVGSVQFAEHRAPTCPKFPQSALQSGHKVLTGIAHSNRGVWEH